MEAQCFRTYVPSPAAWRRLGIQWAKYWKNVSGIFSQPHHPEREVGIQRREIFKNNRTKYLTILNTRSLKAFLLHFNDSLP